MMRNFLFAAAFAAAALATPAHAQDASLARDLGYVKDRPTIALDPNTSYMIVRSRSGAASFAFVRIADEVDVADYRARRAAALAKAHKKWVTKHASWKKRVASFSKLSSSERAYSRDKPGPEPIEPTDANLAFTPMEVENMISFGPFNRFAKDDMSVYIFGVRPGRYAFYGPVMVGAQGALGTCMCMGTFAFEVKPGQIVDAGTLTINLLSEREKAKAAGREPPKDEFDLPETMTSVSWEAPVAGANIDPRLTRYRVEAADLRASRRMPNYLGLTIDRLTPIEGILDYQRDLVIDVKTGQPAR